MENTTQKLVAESMNRLGGCGVEISIKNDESGVVVELCGRLDADGAPLLQKAFDEMGEGLYGADAAVDFSAVDYISSSGLRVLLVLQKKVHAARGSLNVRNLNGAVREVFDMTGFSAIFKV
ncbi:MAG: STAS domain-containing protein [Synergistaceae bacterium]|nr:STAS domain-containing protein [Synergistaceae bacterium]